MFFYVFAQKDANKGATEAEWAVGKVLIRVKETKNNEKGMSNKKIQKSVDVEAERSRSIVGLCKPVRGIQISAVCQQERGLALFCSTHRLIKEVDAASGPEKWRQCGNDLNLHSF